VKLKLDENLAAAGAGLLKSAGFDVATVAEQNLRSTPDADLARICTAEGRCLVTLDKDFSDPLRYPPKEHAGLVVVRLPGRFQLSLLERALALVVKAAERRDVRGRLWIAEMDRVREYQERDE
jgi:predicted nuclease of predicted toxin-antitoxin system